MKRRLFSIIIILNLILSFVAPAFPAQAADSPFQSPDSDGDGLSNEMETKGWYINGYGPFITNPFDADTDHDGLTDGEEKLFNTGPTGYKSPGLAVKYNKKYQTIQYFSASDGSYLNMIQGGDQYLMRFDGFVVRRGTTLNIVATQSGNLTISGTGLTPLIPYKDPANGGWAVDIPLNGKVGTYTATITVDTWSMSMPIYVIFELPTDLPSDQTAAFLYDDDPANKKDEVAVWFTNDEWSYYGNGSSNPVPCPGADPNTPCSNWQYHSAAGYAEAFWTEQFKKKVFLSHTIKAINGQSNINNAAFAIGEWADREFRINYAYRQNSWYSAMYTWNDGTGVTMTGGGCETTASVFVSMLRSAGIAARHFAQDYNKTAGHGETGQIGNPWEYDHSVMMWLDHTWKAEQNYSAQEGKYYPWASGTTGIKLLKNFGYRDKNGDILTTAGAGWDFQNGSNGGGMVNTVWPILSIEKQPINRDYEWFSNFPLQITQSPYLEILSCQLWKGDGWAPSEWLNPPVSNPEGRNAIQTYYLPSGIPDLGDPLENWPYNPKPIACSPSTPADVCNAFKASWTATCPAIPGSQAIFSLLLQGSNNLNNLLYLPAILLAGLTNKPAVQLGDIVEDRGVDRDGDGRYDELVVKSEVTSSRAGEFQLGGYLQAGDKTIRADASRVTLTPGAQTVEVTFDGQQIGDNQVNGPYQVESLWIAPADQPVLQIVDPEKMLDYKEYTYSTKAYTAAQFKIQAASIKDEYSHTGIDSNDNGLYEAIKVNVSLNIAVPGTFQVEGILYDGLGNFVGHATWTGSDPVATLQFNVAKTQPPYTLEQLSLIDAKGALLDSRYASPYKIEDMAGRIEAGMVSFASIAAKNGPLGVTPNSFAITPVDTNSNGRYDTLDVTVGVTVTGQGGAYRIEGLLIDDQGVPAAWSVSDPQTLAVGQGQMHLVFDGRMIYDQLPLAPMAKAFKLVAVKIYSGTLSPSTLEAQTPVAATTPAYSRSQFEPSSPAENVFQDDMENGTGKWTWALPLWSQNTNVWSSWSHSWIASASTPKNGSLSTTSQLDLSNYASPALRFTHAYLMTPSPATDKGTLEASMDGGTTWTQVATYSGSTPRWSTEQIDLSAYGKQANVKLRFNAQSQSGLLWYIDDVYLNAWPAVTSASFTYSQPVEAIVPATFTADYTSINTTLPITYTWDFGDATPVVKTTSPNVAHSFASAGDPVVKLTVQNPYDGTFTSQIVHVIPSTNPFILAINVTPSDGGTVTKNPDRPGYNPGDVVQLTAYPATGYTFGSWSGGGCMSTNPCMVTMNADITVTATFISMTMFTISHEANNFNEYDKTYLDGGNLSISAAAALNGTSYGLRVNFPGGSTTPKYAVKGMSLLADSDFRCLFYFDPNSITLSTANIRILNTSDNSTGYQLLGVVLKYAASNYRLLLGVINDSHTYSYGSEIIITDAPHYIEVLAHRSSSPGGTDGYYKMWIDGTLQSTVSNVANYNQFGLTNKIAFGASSGVVTGVTGSYYIDEITANRDGSLIGP